MVTSANKNPTSTKQEKIEGKVIRVYSYKLNNLLLLFSYQRRRSVLIFFMIHS